MQIKIKNCRMSFSNLFTPWTPAGGDPKFTFNGICSDDTTVTVTNADGKQVTVPHTKFPEVIAQIVKEKWGKAIPATKLQLFVYNRADTEVGSRGPRINDEGEYYEGYEADTMFFSAGTKVKDAPDGILVVDQKRNKLDASSPHPVNGDYVNAVLSVYAYEYEGKKGVSASIEGVQFLRKGEPFGAGKIEATAFDEEELEDDEEVGDEELF